MRERGEWRCALEECGGLCVTEVGAPLMLLWCAGSWDLKWMHQGDVSLFQSLGLEKVCCNYKVHGVSMLVESISYCTDPTAYHNAQYGQGNGSIFLNNLRCTGRESSLLDCQTQDAIGNPRYCSHSDDAGVRCPCKN